MRISDWSSDVCSSDRVETTFMQKQMGLPDDVIEAIKEHERGAIPLGRRGVPADVGEWIAALARPQLGWMTGQIIRSAERRGGKECVSTCRYRWSADH